MQSIIYRQIKYILYIADKPWWVLHMYIMYVNFLCTIFFYTYKKLCFYFLCIYLYIYLYLYISPRSLKCVLHRYFIMGLLFFHTISLRLKRPWTLGYRWGLDRGLLVKTLLSSLFTTVIQDSTHITVEVMSNCPSRVPLSTAASRFHIENHGLGIRGADPHPSYFTFDYKTPQNKLPIRGWWSQQNYISAKKQKWYFKTQNEYSVYPEMSGDKHRQGTVPDSEVRHWFLATIQQVGTNQLREAEQRNTPVMPSCPAFVLGVCQRVLAWLFYICSAQCCNVASR